MARASLRAARGRTARALARAEAAEAALARLEASAAWRVTYPLRRAAHAVPPSIYGALRPGARSGRAGGTEAAPNLAEPESPPDTRPLALILDDHFPDPDSDSGSIDIVNLAEALRDEGFAVALAADRDHGDDHRPASAGLVRRGLRALGRGDGIDTPDVIRRLAPGAALVVLNRLYCGGRFLESVAAAAPRAAIIFNTVDLHWIRIGREAELANDDRLRVVAIDARAREGAIAAAADASLVVSDRERALLEAEAPGALVIALPLARPLRPPVAPFAGRAGIGFIGGFRHQPNVDGLNWFLREVWPLVRAADPSIRLSVVGADLPPSLLAGVGDEVEALGHLPDVDPWFERLRVTIAPIRYGAGVKGKVVSSLAAGVPCVATTVALEGVEFINGGGALRADTPDAFAAGVVALHQQEGRWAAMSTGAQEIAKRRFALDPWRHRLHDLLWSLDLLPRGSSPGGTT